MRLLVMGLLAVGLAGASWWWLASSTVELDDVIVRGEATSADGEAATLEERGLADGVRANGMTSTSRPSTTSPAEAKITADADLGPRLHALEPAAGSTFELDVEVLERDRATGTRPVPNAWSCLVPAAEWTGVLARREPLDVSRFATHLPSRYTDRDGIASFDGIPEGDAVLVVLADGYANHVQELSFDAEDVERVRYLVRGRLTVILQPPALVVDGTVVDAEGRPAARALVLVSENESPDSDRFRRRASTRRAQRTVPPAFAFTDERGAFRLSLGRARDGGAGWTVRVLHRRHDATAVVDEARRSLRSPLRVRLPPLVPVRLTIVDPDDAPVPGPFELRRGRDGTDLLALPPMLDVPGLTPIADVTANVLDLRLGAGRYRVGARASDDRPAPAPWSFVFEAVDAPVHATFRVPPPDGGP